MDRKLGGLVLGLFLAGPALAQKINDVDDRFTGERKIDYLATGQMGFGSPKFGIMVRAGGQNPITAVRFMSSPPLGRYARQDPQYMRCDRIDWLVDGKPLPLGIVVHDLQRFDRVLVEFVSQSLTDQQLAQIGAAQQVEYRLCGTTEGILTQENLAAARDIAARLSGSPPPPAPSTPGHSPIEVRDETIEPRRSDMKYRPKGW